MRITICIGSSCHMQGAMDVIDRLQEHLQARNLIDEVELSGCMCTGQCRRGVCVRVDGALFSVTPDNVEEFIEIQIDGRLAK